MTPVLSVMAVSKRYGRQPVLRDVTFSVSESDVVGVIGPNGVGKTTLLRIVVGLQQASGGSVQIQRGSVQEGLKRLRVAYFGGESTVPGHVRSHRWRALFHHIEPGAGREPIRLLSRGTRQMLGLRTVFTLPALRLIVLDEPWEGLDPDAARWLTGAVRARRDAGAAVLISSHRLHDLAGVCDSYVFLDAGVSTCIPAGELARDGVVTGDELLRTFDTIRGGTR
ncbi:MAG: hypothetical protein A3H96_00190 [Acidobacteria bacterium RIFCSPLOWO2_02_FULL_67_36]|nr:MAG: hypothetical protein A3H96_00190 [Acidobacteria bacterium RIFCSPLOWO2_02_FULL_67_36]OFW19608.1 MAG: hypothetical protein A3G21_21630 [Acidobacteria bacterium RIFCSPLOWO2_12_FULL_66_21]